MTHLWLWFCWVLASIRRGARYLMDLVRFFRWNRRRLGGLRITEWAPKLDPQSGKPIPHSAIGNQILAVVEEAVADILARLRAVRCDEQAIGRFGSRLAVALQEALTNAAEHGNRADPRKGILFCWRVRGKTVHMFVRDDGPGFDPASIPDPTLPENLEKASGRGLLLMRTFMDVVHMPPGNRVYMSKQAA